MIPFPQKMIPFSLKVIPFNIIFILKNFFYKRILPTLARASWYCCQEDRFGYKYNFDSLSGSTHDNCALVPYSHCRLFVPRLQWPGDQVQWILQAIHLQIPRRWRRLLRLLCTLRIYYAYKSKVRISSGDFYTSWKGARRRVWKESKRSTNDHAFSLRKRYRGAYFCASRTLLQCVCVPDKDYAAACLNFVRIDWIGWLPCSYSCRHMLQTGLPCTGFATMLVC